jgi:hypothetical protein
MSEAKLTQHMTMHLNGGGEFSELHYEIHADGKPTGITRRTRTDGRPKYRITADEMHCGDECFDILATKGAGMIDWIESRLLSTPEAPNAPD